MNKPQRPKGRIVRDGETAERPERRPWRDRLFQWLLGHPHRELIVTGIKRLDLKAGDTLVVTVAGLTPENVQTLRWDIQDALRQWRLDVQVFVVSEGIEVEKASPEGGEISDAGRTSPR